MTGRGVKPASRSPLTPSSALSNGAADTQASAVSGDTAKSRAEEVSESFRRLSAEALQHNARQWLSCLVASPLPPEATFRNLVHNGALLARVTASLVAATRAGTREVTLVVVTDDDLGVADSPRSSASQVKSAQEHATAFVTNCQALGVRAAELCTTHDVLSCAASSGSGGGARAVCVTLYAVSLRAKALGLRVPPFPVNDVPQLPRDATKERAAQFNVTVVRAPSVSASAATPASGARTPTSTLLAGGSAGVAAPATPDVAAAPPMSVVGDSGTPHSMGSSRIEMSPAEAAPDDAVSVSGDVLLRPTLTPAATPAATPVPTPARVRAAAATPDGSAKGAGSLWNPGGASQTLYVATAAAAGAALVATAAYIALNAGSQRGRTTRWRTRGGDVLSEGSLVLWRAMPAVARR